MRLTSAHPPARHRAGVVYRGIDLSTQPVPPEPHRDLGAATRTLHTWLVESAACFHGPDAAAISEAVYLPIWNVKRALFVLGLGPDPNPRPAAVQARHESRVARARAYLRTHGPATAPEVAAGTGLNPRHLAGVLKNNPDTFTQCGERKPPGRGRVAPVWQLVGAA